MSFTLRVNGEQFTLNIDRTTPLLWAIRDHVGYKSAKFGCGVGICGSCTVEVNGMAVRSCSIAAGDVEGFDIVTIEGLSPDGSHPIQRAWVEEQVPQCGYCQPGMIMAVSALLRANASPSDADISDQITNICRCGTYVRIRRAIHRAAELTRAELE